MFSISMKINVFTTNYNQIILHIKILYTESFKYIAEIVLD